LAANGKKPALVWSKLASAKWEDAWVERLRFLGPGRLAIFSLPGSKRIRIEAYGLGKRDAARVLKTFGGQVRELKGQSALPAQQADGPPLVIRDQLVIVRSPRAAKEAAKKHPGRTLLIVPAAMAFGTGDHATTATCLRMICDLAGTFTGKWEALDLGTGTGILAMAARAIGAVRCDAWDYDPACIRAVRENARLNAMRHVPAARVDVTTWTPTRQWNLVTANLFSDLLVKVAPKIVSAVAPGGRLVLSGILTSQSREAIAGFERLGVRFQRVVKKGKWVSALSKPFPARPTRPDAA